MCKVCTVVQDRGSALSGPNRNSETACPTIGVPTTAVFSIERPHRHRFEADVLSRDPTGLRHRNLELIHSPMLDCRRIRHDTSHASQGSAFHLSQRRRPRSYPTHAGGREGLAFSARSPCRQPTSSDALRLEPGQRSTGPTQSSRRTTSVLFSAVGAPPNRRRLQFRDSGALNERVAQMLRRSRDSEA